MDQFILFGDSITQQCFSQHGTFGSTLSEACIRKLDIINRGLSGYNTTQALKVLPHVIPSPDHARVRFLTIFFGANDARLPDTPPEPQQHVPLELFRDNLRSIATHPLVRAHENVRIILITPPPVDERTALASDASKSTDRPLAVRRSAVVTAQYAEAVRALGRELRLPVLDIWSAMMREAGYTRTELDSTQLPGSSEAPESAVLQGFLHDGLHFSRSAYDLLYSELLASIGKLWPDQLPESLPFVLPKWDEKRAWQNGTASIL